MLKRIVFFIVLISQGVFAQNAVVFDSIVDYEKTLFFNNKSYEELTSVQSDSIMLKKVYSFSSELFPDLQMALSHFYLREHFLNQFIIQNDTVDYKFFINYVDNRPYEGLDVFKHVVNDQEKVGLALFQEGSIQSYYHLDKGYNYFVQLLSSLEAKANNQSLDDHLAKLGHFVPYESLRFDDDWKSKLDLRILQENENEEDVDELVVYTVGGNDNFIFIHIINKDVQKYVLIKREGTLTSISLVDDTKVLSSLSIEKFTLVNIGFDQKRVALKTKGSEGLWDVYLEEVGGQAWKAPFQEIRNYNRVGDKRKMRMRVVKDSRVVLESSTENIVFALASNPELFRRDLALSDFDYSGLLKGVIKLQASKKPTYISVE